MRKDGKRVKNVDPMYTLAAYFMEERNDSQNMITVNMPYEPIHNYVLDARKRGVRISHYAVIIAAITRTVSQHRALNRFVVNKKIYARNDYTVGMVVMRPHEANPSMDKMHIELTDTIFQINDKINAFVEGNKYADSENKSDKLFKRLLSLSFLVRFGMWALRKIDKWFGLPRAITSLSPFHNSLTFTNLASIRTNHIYHHVYNFGTTSMLIAMGNLVDIPKNEKGQVVLEKCVPLGIVMDERIATGGYYAEAFADMEKYLKNPALLETEPETLDVDFEFPKLSYRFANNKKKRLKEMP